jgi:hypothetical protein
VHFLEQAADGAASSTASALESPSPQGGAGASGNSSSIVSSPDSHVALRRGSSIDSPVSLRRGSANSASVITVESMRQMTEDLMPGVFTATLKVMIDVDEQPAVDCISLDESVINLLSCFAKCYGKGHAQNRRGIIQFASSKVSRFRTFVTLRFCIATRSLSYISKPLSICNVPNFW